MARAGVTREAGASEAAGSRGPGRAAGSGTFPAALVFVGFMGAGKSTAARAAARELGIPALDSDRLVEERVGMPVARMFAERGEAAFRAEEERVVLEALEHARRAAEVGPPGRPGAAIALGGGSLGSPRVRDALVGQRVVLIDISLEDAWLRARGSGRPLAGDRERFAMLHAARQATYDEVAGAILPANRDRGIVRRALPAVRALDGAPPGTVLLWAAIGSAEHPVFVGRGTLGADLWAAPGRPFLVTDRAVGALHGARAGDVAARVEVEPGEEHKSLAAAEAVWRELARAGMTRADHVLALGGGVVGDLAGFCAATYQRGVPVVQLPTTLVAQVDSAYGGKTGIDLPEAKNYVGAYHQPAAVIADPDVLATLPARELAAGYAEVLKTALVAGGPLWERVRAGGEPDEDGIVVACARTKLAVVAADERDGGRRQVLNLGHTIGHAIETVTGYRRYRHGEAVGLGLLAALRLSGRPDLRAEVAVLLAARGLPTTLGGADPADVTAATARDKKRLGEGPVPFVLLEEPGTARPGCSVPADDVRAAVAELTRTA